MKRIPLPFRPFALFAVLTGMLLLTPAHAQDWLPLPPPPPAVAEGAQATGPFTLQYPTSARPARVMRKFVPVGTPNPAREYLALYAPAGSAITAGAAGRVRRVVTAEDGRGYGAYVVIRTQHDGMTYNVTYGGLTAITVSEGDTVVRGGVIGRAAGDQVRLAVQSPQLGRTGYALPNIVDPSPMLRLQGLRLRPTVNNLRMRAAPSLDAPIIGMVSTWNLLSTPETHYTAMFRMGREGQWLRINRPGGGVAYVAAWYIEVISQRDPGARRPQGPLAGMNLDLNHALGSPPAAPLRNLGWVRMTYNLSYNPFNGTYGNTDIGATYARYQPVLKRYADNGNKVILVLTHQFYGEGAGFVWEQMSTSQWQTLINRYADLARQVAAQYAGQQIVYAYQIWNEQDTPPEHARAAVPMPPAIYAQLLTQTIQAIRSADPQAQVITGGHISGNVLGVNYARTVLNAMPAGVRPDGIAFHPYGVGPRGSPFNIFGVIDDAVRAWSVVMPGRPLWITEWGVLDRQGDDGLAPQVVQFATDFLNTLQHDFNGAVAAAVWYAWADTMDNGYGLVNAWNQPKEPLYSAFLNFQQRFTTGQAYG